jgi:hypothetical protein
MINIEMSGFKNSGDISHRRCLLLRSTVSGGAQSMEDKEKVTVRLGISVGYGSCNSTDDGR